MFLCLSNSHKKTPNFREWRMTEVDVVACLIHLRRHAEPCSSYVISTPQHQVGSVDEYRQPPCCHLILKGLIKCISHGEQKFFFKFEILNVFISSFSFICIHMLWGLRALDICLLFQCGDRLQTSESDVRRRQILTSKVDLCAVRVK